MYGEFDPEILITPARGKVFEQVPNIEGIEGVVGVTQMLEQETMLLYRGQQREATIIGVDTLYDDQLVSGAGVAYDLGLNIHLMEPVEAFAPRKGGGTGIIPVDVYRRSELWPVRIFALDAETDGRYVLAPLESVRTLSGYLNGVSALGIKTDGRIGEVQERLRERLGEGFRVQTQYEQKEALFTIMKYEKWGIFLIVLMVMVIASMAIVGSIVMLVIDKSGDIRTLRALGAREGFIRGIFVREGFLISGLGAAGGMALGLAVCWAQQAFGFVRIPARTFLVDSYPVIVQGIDLVLIAAAFFAVSFIIVRFTVRGAIKGS